MFFASLLLVAAADPCAIPQPAPAQDPVAGSAYLEVGESELGHDSALVAFREALRLDPANARARRGFLLACTPKEARFDRARALMDEGDQRTAILLFEQVRADEGSSPSASLLEGICLYEVGEDARAKPLLQEAFAQPAIADSARFFLGLIALREGNEEVARRELSRVSEASALRGDAQGLLGATQVAGKLSITCSSTSSSGNCAPSPAGSLRWEGPTLSFGTRLRRSSESNNSMGSRSLRPQ